MISKTSTDESDEKFVPKRRAPYLLQEEVVKEKAGLTRNSRNKQKSRRRESKDEDNNKENVSQKNEVGSTSTTDAMLNYHREALQLTGIQKKIILYFVDSCLKRRNTTTGPVTVETLCAISKTTSKTIKKILQRMVEKKIIFRVGGKKGKGGFSEFELMQEFIDVARLQFNLESNHAINTGVPIRVENEIVAVLPKEWQEISFEEIKEIGFGLSHIKQLYSKKSNSPAIIQESINHFAYTLKFKPAKLQKYENKIAPFMSTLLNGGESDYVSPNEIAFNQFVDQRKKRIEKFKQQEEEYFIAEYVVWESSLTEQEKNDFIPQDVRNTKISAAKKAALHTYFRENIWINKIPQELINLRKELEI